MIGILSRMSNYNAQSIEVLSGLEPVRRRPGMYTDTQRPNHLIQEVVDNSVDEAMGGHCDRIEITLLTDGAFVADNGRGMPVDIHPEHGVPGIELILTRLHAGGKFSGENYKFSGGLHGVGVSVVNALSTPVELVKDAQVHAMAFANGDVVEPLTVIGKVGQKNTGTRDSWSMLDTPKYGVKALKHLLRAKAVSGPCLTIDFKNDANAEDNEVVFEAAAHEGVKER